MDNFWYNHNDSFRYRPFTLEEAYEIPIMHEIAFTLSHHSDKQSNKQLFMMYGLFHGHPYIVSRKEGIYREFIRNEPLYISNKYDPGDGSLINMFVFDIWNRDHVKLGRFRHDLFSKLD